MASLVLVIGLLLAIVRVASSGDDAPPEPEQAFQRVIDYAVGSEDRDAPEIEGYGLGELDADIALLMKAFDREPQRLRPLLEVTAETLAEPVYLDLSADSLPVRPERLRARARRILRFLEGS